MLLKCDLLAGDQFFILAFQVDLPSTDFDMCFDKLGVKEGLCD